MEIPLDYSMLTCYFLSSTHFSVTWTLAP